MQAVRRMKMNGEIKAVSLREDELFGFAKCCRIPHVILTRCVREVTCCFARQCNTDAALMMAALVWLLALAIRHCAVVIAFADAKMTAEKLTRAKTMVRINERGNRTLWRENVTVRDSRSAGARFAALKGCLSAPMRRAKGKSIMTELFFRATSG